MVASPLNTSEEISFTLFDITLRGLRWGNKQSKNKVLALHGWLDNCASFSRLLPYLDDIDCIALDLAGHGKSDFRDGYTAYNSWDDLKDILQLVDQLGWEQVTLLGHSRGASISTLFAGAFPERVNGVFLIDGVVPFIIDETELPANLGQSVRDAVGMQIKPRRRSYFESFEDAARARLKSDLPICETAAFLLAERSVTQNAEGRYYWHYDQRLLLPSEVKFSSEQIHAFLDALPVKVKVIAANQGFLPRIAPEIMEHGHDNIVLEFLDGTHHLHVDDDEPTRIQIAEYLNEYLESRI